jgi:hypothetical protein
VVSMALSKYINDVVFHLRRARRGRTLVLVPISVRG